jgi:hypothetical protein
MALAGGSPFMGEQRLAGVDFDIDFAGEDMPIEHKPIRRGGIKSAGYERSARILEIEFDSGSIIQYSGVGDEIARRFLSSTSPMSYYKDVIDEEFSQKRVK